MGRAESFPFSWLNISDIFRAFALDAEEFQFGDDDHHQESDKRSNATTTKAGAHFALFFVLLLIIRLVWCLGVVPSSVQLISLRCSQAAVAGAAVVHTDCLNCLFTCCCSLSLPFVENFLLCSSVLFLINKKSERLIIMGNQKQPPPSLCVCDK